jgi:hypothetical protein
MLSTQVRFIHGCPRGGFDRIIRRDRLPFLHAGEGVGHGFLDLSWRGFLAPEESIDTNLPIDQQRDIRMPGAIQAWITYGRKHDRGGLPIRHLLWP